TSSTVTLKPTPFQEVDYFIEDFNPLNGKGGGTHIFDALNEAKKIAEDFLANATADGVKHSVVMLLMSDGLCFQPETTIAVANSIKQNKQIDIASAYFAEIGKSDREVGDIKNLLQTIATN